MKYLLTTAIFCIVLSCQRQSECLETLARPLSIPFSSDDELRTTTVGVEECLASVLGDVYIQSPEDFDPRLKDANNFHGKDDSLTYPQLAKESVFLHRIASNDHYSFYLLRIVTGEVMEGERYDIIFTTTPEGRLIDTMLAASMGTLYIRKLLIQNENQFVIDETTGREGKFGPGYISTFTVNEGGKFVVESSEISTGDLSGDDLIAAYGEVEPVEDAPETYESLLVVDGNDPIKEINEKLFSSDSGLAADYLEAHNLFGKRAFIAVGRKELADLTVFILQPIDNTQYTVKSFRLPANTSSDLYGGKLKGLKVNEVADAYEIVVEAEESWAVQGGDQDGEPASQDRVKKITLWLRIDGLSLVGIDNI